MSTPDSDVQMQLDPIESQKTVILPSHDDWDEYSDFTDDPEALEIIDQLFLEAATWQNQESNAPLRVTDIEDYEGPRGVHLPKVPGLQRTLQGDFKNQHPAGIQAQQIVRDKSADRRRSRNNEEDVKVEGESSPKREPTADVALQAPAPDTRSPLDRFRKPPKKALSVTDLISPSWCELQYYYVLTKHGRKRRTPAMKQGTAVHQVLENEVHITVPVEITKKEDSWALRIWNIIQGLQTLRETGKTRELEIWGSLGGELVNGVIDELSYNCPDPKLEQMSRSLLERKDAEPPLPEYQASIRDYLVTNDSREQGQSLSEALGNSDDAHEAGDLPPRETRELKREDERRIYLTDVKTRQFPTLPTGSAIRPTLVQLHLYHHMLENLAQGKFSLTQLAERYKLDVIETFSDSFIAQIGGLNQEVFALSQQSDEPGHNLPPSTQDSMDILLSHNTLASLWEFMMEQLRLTFILPSATSSTSQAAPTSTSTSNTDLQDPFLPPPSSLSQLPTPPSHPTRLSPILTARYISTNYKHLPTGADASTARILGSKSLLFNPSFLTAQLYSSLGFWKGEREPRGVEVSDAWKCRVCEFRDECVWVKERDEKMVREAKERRRVKGEVKIGDGGEGEGRRSRV